MSGVDGFAFAPANSPKKRKAEDASTNGSSGGAGSASAGNGVGKKTGENLDFRLRVAESILMANLRVEKEKYAHPVWQMLFGAKQHWEAAKGAKGEKHVSGPERHTLAIGVLKIMKDADTLEKVTTLFTPVTDQVKAHDAMAGILGNPIIAKQVEALGAFAKTIQAGPAGFAKMAEWIAHLQFTETKKGDAMLLRFAIKDESTLKACGPALSLLFQAAGAIPLDGTAPPGPSFHTKKK